MFCSYSNKSSKLCNNTKIVVYGDMSNLEQYQNKFYVKKTWNMIFYRSGIFCIAKANFKWQISLEILKERDFFSASPIL